MAVEVEIILQGVRTSGIAFRGAVDDDANAQTDTFVLLCWVHWRRCGRPDVIP